MNASVLEAAGPYIPSPDGPLSFVTYSNKGSGLLPHAHVLWFVFAHGANTPHVVGKTTRDGRASGALERSFANLTTLAAIDPDLFAKPLYGSPTLSLETYVNGQRIHAWPPSLSASLFERYITFQKRAGSSGTVTMDVVLKTLSQELLTPGESSAFLQKCSRHFPTPPLPAYPQHGDLTRDNVLVHEGAMHIVDYEYAHLTQLPGYDIYNFFCRESPRMAREKLVAYATALGFSYAENHLALFPALHELIEAQKKRGRLRTRTADPELLLALIP